MPGRVICVSQSAGSGGTEVGKLIAARLGWRHVDEEIVRRAAEREGLDLGVVADIERRRSFVRRMLDALTEATHYDAILAGAEETPAPDELRESIREVIRETADEGDVVIVSHAASLALAGLPDLLRVFVTASPEIRARRLEGADPLAFDEAKRRVTAEDAARADYLRRFYGAEEEPPTLYDLVVSTDVLTVGQAADLVVAAARL